MTGNRQGSQLVEATFLLPLTVLLMVALIGLFVTFFGDLQAQCRRHAQERYDLYSRAEVNKLRLRDSLETAASGIARGPAPGSGEDGEAMP